MKVGGHQGSVLSRLFVAMVMLSLCKRFGPNGGNYGRTE